MRGAIKVDKICTYLGKDDAEADEGDIDVDVPHTKKLTRATLMLVRTTPEISRLTSEIRVLMHQDASRRVASTVPCPSVEVSNSHGFEDREDSPLASPAFCIFTSTPTAQSTLQHVEKSVSRPT